MWTIWSVRYELPLFALGAALTGFVLERWFPRRAGVVVAVLLVLWAAPFAIANRCRSLVPWKMVANVYHSRAVLYFTDGQEAAAPFFIAAADAINRLDCGDIALDSYVSPAKAGHDPLSYYVYPLLAMIRDDGFNRGVWYTDVNNLTERYDAAENHPKPCAVVCVDCANAPAKWAEYHRFGWRASVFDYIVLFSAGTGTPRGR